MRIKRLLSTILCLAIFIGIIPVISVGASGDVEIQDRYIYIDSDDFYSLEKIPEFRAGDPEKYFVDNVGDYSDTYSNYNPGRIVPYSDDNINLVLDLVVDIYPEEGYTFKSYSEDYGYHKTYDYVVVYNGNAYTPEVDTWGRLRVNVKVPILPSEDKLTEAQYYTGLTSGNVNIGTTVKLYSARAMKDYHDKTKDVSVYYDYTFSNTLGLRVDGVQPPKEYTITSNPYIRDMEFVISGEVEIGVKLTRIYGDGSRDIDYYTFNYTAGNYDVEYRTVGSTYRFNGTHKAGKMYHEWNYRLSNTDFVSFNDGTPNSLDMPLKKEDGELISVEFSQVNDYTVQAKHYQEYQEYKGGKYTYDYEYIIRAEKPKEISATQVVVDSKEFYGGSTFPDLTVGEDVGYEVYDAYFDYDMERYRSRSRLPYLTRGSKVSLKLEIRPDKGRYFNEDYKYTVRYKDRIYEATVVRNISSKIVANYLIAYVDATFTGGEIYEPCITDLELPTHGMPAFDLSADAGELCTVTEVKYFKDSKEISTAKYGDNIVIRVYLECDEKHTFDDFHKAYWKEADLYSGYITTIDDRSAYYDFRYTVGKGDAILVTDVYLSVMPPVEGSSAASDMLTTSTRGVVPEGGAEWTWWQTGLAGMTCDVKVAFKQDETAEFHMLNPKLVEEGAVYVNGVKAEKVYEDKNNPGIFYAEAEIEVEKYAFTASATPYSITVNNYFSTYVLNRPSAANYVGFYDGMGRLVGADTKHIGGGGVSIYFDVPEGAEFCKVMMWEDKGSFVPMADALTLPIPSSPISVYVPMDVSVDDESVIGITAEASGGRGEYTYRWQYSHFDSDALNWTTWKDATDEGDLADVFVGGIGTDTLQVRGSVNTIANKSLRVRCVVSDNTGEVASSDNNTAITVNELSIEAVISTNETWVTHGESNNIAVVVYYGGGNYTYEWEYTENGENWYKISTLSGYDKWFDGITTSTLTIKAPDATGKPDGMQVRCRIRSDSNWSMKSDACTIRTSASYSAVLTPAAYKLRSGKIGLFVASAVGSSQSPYTYTWQFKPYGSDEGWTHVTSCPEVFTGGTSNYIFFKGYKADYPNGILVQCVMKDANGKTSFSDTGYIRFVD